MSVLFYLLLKEESLSSSFEAGLRIGSKVYAVSINYHVLVLRV